MFAHFYYYRFAVIALLFAFVGWVQVGENIFSPSVPKLEKRSWLALGGILILLLANDLSLLRYDFSGYYFSQVPMLQWQEKIPPPEAVSGRTWFIDHHRPGDVGLDAQAILSTENIKSNKGLYWESHRSHSLQLSYLATLLGTSGPVTEASSSLNCEQFKCVFDNYARDNQLEKLVIENPINPEYLSQDRKTCLQEILDHGSPLYQLQKTGQIYSPLYQYSIFQMSPKDANDSYWSHSFSKGLIRNIGDTSLTAFSYNESKPTDEYYKRMMSSCREQRKWKESFVNIESLKANEVSLEDLKQILHQPVKNLEIFPVGKASYQINLVGPGTQAFQIMLSYFPGVHLRSPEGRELPIIEALPGLIGVARGSAILSFEKTLPMKIGYLISGLSALIVLIQVLRRRLKSLFKSSEP